MPKSSNDNAKLPVNRTMPHSQEAEDAVIGAFLTNGELFTEFGSKLREEDFYIASDRIIFAAIRDLAAKGMPADIEVMPFTGLLVDFCKELGAGGVVKGLRAMTDFEYELQQADLNFHLSPDIESVFVMSSPEYGYVSSSIVREIASMGSDVSSLVPANVDARLRAHYA